MYNVGHLQRLINHKGVKKGDERFGPSFSKKSIFWVLTTCSIERNFKFFGVTYYSAASVV